MRQDSTTRTVGHIAQREAFALAPEDGVQRHSHADPGDESENLEQRAHVHARVAAGADDEVRVVEHLVIQRQRRDRDEGDDHEHARDPRDVPKAGRKWSRKGYPDTFHARLNGPYTVRAWLTRTRPSYADNRPSRRPCVTATVA